MSLKHIVDSVWHWKIEDNLGWKFCAGILGQNYDIKISAAQLEKDFNKYFEDEVGIAPYTECPACGTKLSPRKSKYGYFVGCSNYPSCEFIATNKQPYKK